MYTLLIAFLSGARAEDLPEISLAEAVERAAQGAVSVQTAQAGEDRARAGAAQAATALLPTIQAQGSLQYWDSPATFSLSGGEEPATPVDCSAVPPPFDAMCASMGQESVVREQLTLSGTLRAVQPLTGMISSAWQYKAARAGVDAAEANSERARELARFSAVDAWYGALEAEAQAEVAASQVRALEARERSVQVSLEAQAAVRNDLLQVGLALSNARQAVLAVEAMEDAAYRGLSVAVGGDGRPLRPGGEVGPPAASLVEDEETLVERALQARDDVAALAAQLESAGASHRATQWQRLPQISAIASVTHQEGQSLGTPPNSGFVGLNADWTLWAWNRQGAAADGARAQVSQLQAQLEGLRASTRMEVASRRTALVTSRASWQVSQASVEQAQENLTLFRTRYDAGMATTLELLDAESQLVNAQSSELRARYGVLRAEAALRLATGG